MKKRLSFDSYGDLFEDTFRVFRFDTDITPFYQTVKDRLNQIYKRNDACFKIFVSLKKNVTLINSQNVINYFSLLIYRILL